MSNKLFDFLQDELWLLNEVKFKSLKNLANKDDENIQFSCETSGQSLFVNYEANDMLLILNKPIHRKYVELINLKPAFDVYGRVGGGYCDFCKEIIDYPVVIENNGYYLIEDNDSYPYHNYLEDGFFPWIELLRNNDIQVNENNEVYLNKAIEANHVWVVPDGILGIGEQGFINLTDLVAISLPKSLQILNKDCFYGCNNLLRIQYRGTISDWNNIIKYNNWNLYTGNYIVYCEDGMLYKQTTADHDEFVTAIHTSLDNTHQFIITLDESNEMPSIVSLNCKFIKNYKYGDNIEFIINNKTFNKVNILTNTGDILLNDCFVKDTIGNFYLELVFDTDEDGNKLGVKNIETVTFIPSYHLMTKKEDSENDES